MTKLIVRRVVGSSMIPTFRQGRILIASNLIRFREGSVVIAVVNGMEVVKRVIDVTDMRVTLVGDNFSASTSYVVHESYIRGTVIL